MPSEGKEGRNEVGKKDRKKRNKGKKERKKMLTENCDH